MLSAASSRAPRKGEPSTLAIHREETESLALIVGRKIRELRQSRGISLNNLARECGVTASLVSQVERGLAAPSLNTLRALADGLHVPLVTFFHGPAPHDGVVMRAADRPRLSLPGSDADYEILSPRHSRRLLVGQLTLGPGRDNASRPMSHRADEVAIVVAGTVEVTWGEDVIRLGTGDSILIPEGVPHRMTNVGEEPAQIMFAIAPPSF